MWQRTYILVLEWQPTDPIKACRFSACKNAMPCTNYCVHLVVRDCGLTAQPVETRDEAGYHTQKMHPWCFCSWNTCSRATDSSGCSQLPVWRHNKSIMICSLPGIRTYAHSHIHTCERAYPPTDTLIQARSHTHTRTRTHARTYTRHTHTMPQVSWSSCGMYLCVRACVYMWVWCLWYKLK